MEKESDLQESSTPCLHLVSAFLACEPTDFVISFARDFGGGSITERVQSFIWNGCINKFDVKCNFPYLKRFLKKLIIEIESNGDVVLDELYEKYTYCLASVKDDELAKGNTRMLRRFLFLFPKDCSQVSSCQISRKLEVTLQCSINMLEGDTGCSIWPSGLFLSEFILSFPEVFSDKSCLEVGSGVGLVGVCLAQANCSKASFLFHSVYFFCEFCLLCFHKRITHSSDISCILSFTMAFQDASRKARYTWVGLTSNLICRQDLGAKASALGVKAMPKATSGDKTKAAGYVDKLLTMGEGIKVWSLDAKASCGTIKTWARQSWQGDLPHACDLACVRDMLLGHVRGA
ncbi:hypothetical protein HAX54_012651 [Datura stramonium]|uniref:Uncharacterized protein n=1 Tax=Datura stramonium TaxID=4076 RepID=A0ABS8TK25_DATST|nr:hypothetical protein [Datura stramonium]